MRRDLIIGILISFFLHAAFGFGGQLMKPKPKKQVVEDEAPAIEVLVPPPVEPEEPEIVDLEDQQTPQDNTSLAPPSLADTPSVVQLNDFTQTVQPPPPPSLGRPTGVMNIPAGRPGTGAIASKIGEVFNLKDLDQRPEPRGIRAKPVYPFELSRQGISGEVVLRFVVDTNGDVKEVEVVRSTQREFESPAIQAVLKWKWKAGRKGGKPVNSRMQIPITFDFNKE
jgi:periplasmic protein TonB